MVLAKFVSRGPTNPLNCLQNSLSGGWFTTGKIAVKIMDNLHVRLNFNLSKEKGIKHHS
jgi:hypothetical protein